MRSYIVKENQIGPAVGEILWYRETDRQRSCYFIVRIEFGFFHGLTFQGDSFYYIYLESSPKKNRKQLLIAADNSFRLADVLTKLIVE